MLRLLPITNLCLHTCPQSRVQMTLMARGRHCAQCGRERMTFFGNSTAKSTGSRTATPGRQFRGSQLASPQPLQQRYFRATVVLVLLQGLIACDITPRAQEENIGSTPALTESTAEATDTAPIICPMEIMPQFPGGIDSLSNYLRRRLRYPTPPFYSAALKSKVFVGFTVLRTGQIANVHLVHGLNPKLDAEALRVVRAMPAWQPGEQLGQPVDIPYTLPIAFLLDPDTSQPKQ